VRPDGKGCIWIFVFLLTAREGMAWCLNGKVRVGFGTYSGETELAGEGSTTHRRSKAAWVEKHGWFEWCLGNVANTFV
jgi:hypothetical protein